MAQIIVNGSVVVASGPKIVFDQTLDVESYENIDVTVPAGATKKEVELPGGTGRVQLIAIVSDWFGDELTYKINDKAAATPDRTLDQPHLLIGKGAISMFADKPASLFFSNTTAGAQAKDAQVQILIGRDATP